MTKQKTFLSPEDAGKVEALRVAVGLPSPIDTEVEAYHFIRDRLKELGWDIRNPERHVGGQLWTQGQCLAHPEIKRCLGLTKPENIVKLTETKLWVIEAKRNRAQLKQALKEAEDDYAKKIIAGGVLQAPLITGIAGNDATGYDIETRLLVSGRYETVEINDVPATGFLDPQSVQALLDSGSPSIADFQVNETLFLKSAEYINRTLHTGGINKNERARVMAALLLSLLDSSSVDVDEDLPVLIDDINTRAAAVLKKHGKKEFFPFVKIEPPTSDENHVKYKAAIVRTIQELKNLNIKSAMKSGADVLGKFYEVFLRYGNGAKEIGIVLTPRHVTRFAVESVGVNSNHLVFDPACGTGGFLVAAFDEVRSHANAAQLERFKKFNLFGIEQESYVAALAIVNMIFRGDGKNNIVEANCFSKFLHRATVSGNSSAAYHKKPASKGDEPIHRVFMNPPFALKKSDEHEWRFVESALQSMEDGGLLFVIVPMSVVTEGGRGGGWRLPLLKHHSVLAVITFPEELFYPVSNQTVAVILKKGVPHPSEQPVLWTRVVNDGFRKSKGKRLPLKVAAPTDLDKIKPLVSAFIRNPHTAVASVPELVKAAPLDLADPILELAPEAYLDSHIPSSKELMARLDRQVRENVGALVEFDLSHNGVGDSIINLATGQRASSRRMTQKMPKFKAVPLSKVFALYPGDYHSLADEDPGSIPVASCADFGNGIIGSYAIPEECRYRDGLTIAFNGSPLTAKLHPYVFGAKDDVAVAMPKDGVSLPVEAIVFIQAQLNAERWRFSYYRKCFRTKLGRQTVELPVKGKALNIEFMVEAVRSQSYWWFLAPRLKTWNPTMPVKPAVATADDE